MQITIKTSKATIVAVKVPEYSADHQVIQSYLWFTCGTILDTDEIKLPEGRWQLLGPPSDITEEVAGEIVDELMFGTITGRSRYRNYVPDKMQSKTYDYCDTRIDSFRSLLTANKVEGNDWIIVKLVPSPL